MVKRCQWGTCNSDTRYPERLDGGIQFVPFPKPKRSLEKCKRWIKACGRPHEQLNTTVIDGNYHMFVCTKHFPEGKPTDRFPDPVSADPITSKTYKAARLPRARGPVLPTSKRRKTLKDSRCVTSGYMVTYTVQGDMLILEGTSRKCASTQNENAANHHSQQGTSDAAVQASMPEVSTLDMLALLAENESLKQQLRADQESYARMLSQQVLKNEDLQRDNMRLLKELRGKTQNKKSAEGIVSVEYFRHSKVKGKCHQTQITD